MSETTDELKRVVTDPRMIGPDEVLSEEQELRAALVAGHNYRVVEAFHDLPWEHPVGRVFWIHMNKVQANDYNPNSVPTEEMRLLHTSISEDGYTQPIVAVYDPSIQRFVIIDGFHRFTTMHMFADIASTTAGYLPVVVLDKSIEDRIASTVRHNRARGAHSVQGMGNLVFQLLREGVPDTEIMRKVGVDAEELARLRHVTGFSKLFAAGGQNDKPYSKVVLTGAQMKAKAEFKKEHPDERIPQY